MNRLETYRDNIGKLIGIIPFVLMAQNLIGYIIFFRYMWLEKEPEWLTSIDLINQQFCSISGWTLLIIFSVSKHFNLLNWISYICLCALWILNTVYLVSNWDADVYFTGCALIIYCIFVVLSIHSLTNRHN